MGYHGIPSLGIQVCSIIHHLGYPSRLGYLKLAWTPCMYWLLYIALHAVFTFKIIGYSITGLLDVGLSIYEAFILANIIRQKLLAGEPYEEERLRLQNIVQNFLPRWNNGNNNQLE